MRHTHGGFARSCRILSCPTQHRLINRTYRAALPLYTSLLDFTPGLVPGFSLSEGRAMRTLHYLLLISLISPATVVLADARQDRADQIEEMSRSFYPPQTAAEAMRAPQHVIVVSNCRLSMVQISRSRRSGLFSGAAFDSDLTTTALKATPDGLLYEHIDGPSPFGILQFIANPAATVTAYRDLTMAPTETNVWSLPASETGETTTWAFSIHSDPTQADMSALADAITRYKRNFCASSS